MKTKFIYPICSNSFKKFLSNKKFEKVYNNLGKPIPFDVTLRDGLQSLTKEQQQFYIPVQKLILYLKIKLNYDPVNIEIGSVVSEKVLPIFKDTLHLFEIINNNEKYIINVDKLYNKKKLYIVVPNKNKLSNVINNTNINYFSFITSVSNSFQMKNTKMSLKDSDNDIYTMLQELDDNKNRNVSPFVKVYVSCINECPIEGKINNDLIVNRLLTLNNMNVDTICLSDTCGSLNSEDFEYIVDTCKNYGINMRKLSLHLHVKNNNESEVEKIFHKALDRKIINFDVSALDSGGCSVTMDKNKLTPNMNYDQYYKFLTSYIIKNS
jgi:isopropylmalate/homocitrate/citramalate synthase